MGIIRVNPDKLKPPVPQQVTRAQGKVVFIQMGLWQQVLDFAAAIPDPTQRALAEVAYRVEVDAAGKAYGLAAGLDEVTAKGVATEIGKALNLAMPAS